MIAGMSNGESYRESKDWDHGPLDTFCLSGCFRKPQQIAVIFRKDLRRRVFSRKALACGRFPNQAGSEMQP